METPQRPQWKVKSNSFTKTFDKEKSARNSYAKQCRKIEEEEKGRVEYFERESTKADWILIQEFELISEE